MSTNGPVPLSRWEIVGAWLHIWTPPRDAQVPPIPWRKVAIAGAILAAGVAAFVAFAVPAIDTGKEEGAAKAARRQAAITAAERARLIREGRVHRGSAELPADLGARNAPAQVAARHALVLSLQSAIQSDALARVRAGIAPRPDRRDDLPPVSQHADAPGGGDQPEPAGAGVRVPRPPHGRRALRLRLPGRRELRPLHLHLVQGRPERRRGRPRPGGAAGAQGLHLALAAEELTAGPP